MPDLRLDKPFDELVSFSNSIKLEDLNDAEHSHIPYLVILYKYLQIWKSQNNGQIPKNYKEKLKFKELVKTGIRRTESDDLKFEENFEEAMKNVNNSITDTKIPSEIQMLFEDEKSLNLNSNVILRFYLFFNNSIKSNISIFRVNLFGLSSEQFMSLLRTKARVNYHYAVLFQIWSAILKDSSHYKMFIKLKPSMILSQSYQELKGCVSILISPTISSLSNKLNFFVSKYLRFTLEDLLLK